MSRKSVSETGTGKTGHSTTGAVRARKRGNGSESTDQE